MSVPWSCSAVEKDKQLHLGVSTVIGASTQYYTEDWKTSMAVCSLVGLTKELKDQYVYNGFDTEDLAYDIVGCALGTLIGDYGLTLIKEDDIVTVNYEMKF